MSVNSKMTAIADEIRTLSGVTGTMGLDAMKTNLGEANDEVDSQASLIAQIAEALESKTAGDSGETAIADVCNISISEYANNLVNISYVKCENGTCTQTDIIPDTSSYIITNVLCDSIVCIEHNPYYSPRSNTDCETILQATGLSFIKLNATTGNTATINVIYNDF